MIFCPFSLCIADKDKFSYGWRYAPGHRSHVLMHFQTPEQKQRPDPCRAYTPVIEVDILTYMYDVRRWLEECTVPNLSGHIHQHNFKLIKGPDGKAPLFYKKWSTSLAWQPAQGLHIVNGRPKGVPQFIAQDKSNMNFAKMAQGLPKYRLHFDSETTRW